MGRLESFCWMSGDASRSGGATKAEQAREYSPSAARVMQRDCWADCLVAAAGGVRRRRGWEGHSSSRSPSSHRRHRVVVKFVACARRAEPLRGAGQRTALGSIRSSAQAVCVLWVATELRARARHWAQMPRAPRGTWRRTGSCAERMCSMSAACKDGRGAAAGAGAGRALASGRHRGWNPLCRWETRRPQTAQVVSWCSWR